MKNLLRNVAYASIIVAATTVTVTHLNRPAEAQSLNGSIVGYHALNQTGTEGIAMVSNGDVFWFELASGGGGAQLHYRGNIWSSGPINVEPSTWSGIKTKLRTPSGN